MPVFGIYQVKFFVKSIARFKKKTYLCNRKYKVTTLGDLV